MRVKREVTFNISLGLSTVSLGLRDKPYDSLYIGTLKELRLKGLTFARIIEGLRFLDISNRRLLDPCKYIDLPQEYPLLLSERTVDRVNLSYISLGLCSIVGEVRRV